MKVDRVTLYDILQPAVPEIPPEQIRFGAQLPPELEVDKEYMRYSYELTASSYLDLTQMLKQETYQVEVELLSKSSDNLFAYAAQVVAAMHSNYWPNLTEASGQQELLYDEGLDMYTIITSFTINI